MVGIEVVFLLDGKPIAYESCKLLPVEKKNAIRKQEP